MNRLPLIVIGMTVGLSTPAMADPPGADDEPWLAEPPLLAQADEPMTDDQDQADDRPDDPRRERLERLREWRQRRNGETDDREGRPGPRGREDRNNRDLSEEDRQNALTVMRDVNPDMAERFADALAGENPDRARRVFDRMAGRLLELHKLKQDQPEAYKLRVADHRAKIATFKLARQLRAARIDRDADRAEQLTTQLREQLESHFEIRQKLRERELAELEQRLERMRDDLAEHRAKKAELIDQSLERIVEGRRPDGPRQDRGRPRDHDQDREERDDQLDLD